MPSNQANQLINAILIGSIDSVILERLLNDPTNGIGYQNAYKEALFSYKDLFSSSDVIDRHLGSNTAFSIFTQNIEYISNAFLPQYTLNIANSSLFMTKVLGNTTCLDYLMVYDNCVNFPNSMTICEKLATTSYACQKIRDDASLRTLFNTDTAALAFLFNKNTVQHTVYGDNGYSLTMQDKWIPSKKLWDTTSYIPMRKYNNISRFFMEIRHNIPLCTDIILNRPEMFKTDMFGQTSRNGLYHLIGYYDPAGNNLVADIFRNNLSNPNMQLSLDNWLSSTNGRAVYYNTFNWQGYPPVFTGTNMGVANVNMSHSIKYSLSQPQQFNTGNGVQIYPRNTIANYDYGIITQVMIDGNFISDIDYSYFKKIDASSKVQSNIRVRISASAATGTDRSQYDEEGIWYCFVRGNYCKINCITYSGVQTTLKVDNIAHSCYLYVPSSTAFTCDTYILPCG